MKNVFTLLLICILTLFIGCTNESDFIEETVEEQKENPDTDSGMKKLPRNLFVRGDQDGNRRDSNKNGFATIWLRDGDAMMSFPKKNTFELKWNRSLNIVGGKGWKIAKKGDSKYNIKKKINYKLEGKDGQIDFAGVYGWTANPPIEYYVVEKGNHFIKEDGYIRSKRYWANGSYYIFYKKRMPISPSAVCENCYFWQYVSVRQNQPKFNMKSSKTVNMSKHVSIWKKNGFVEEQSFRTFGTPAAYQVFGVETRGLHVSGRLKAKIN